MKNTEKMVDVKIACFNTDSKPRIKWYISAPGTMNDDTVIKCGQQAWISEVIKMNKDELYWVLDAVKKKNTMTNIKIYKSHSILKEPHFVVIEAGVPEGNSTSTTTCRQIARGAIRDSLLSKCVTTDCSACLLRREPFTNIENECVLPRVDHAFSKLE